MGVNNRQRRAAKQRKRQRRHGSRRPGEARTQQDGSGSEQPGQDEEGAAYADVQHRVISTVHFLCGRKVDDAQLHGLAASLLRMVRPQPRELVEIVLADLLSRLVESVRRGGWDEHDLVQLVTRHAGEQQLSMLRSVLDGGRGPRLATDARLGSGLAVASQLASAPLLGESAGTQRSGSGAAGHPKLAQARALLAKAESTEFEEEAEALTAKAQELISRYALHRLIAQDSSDGGHAGPQTRRIWLDAPYARAKAALVQEVATANRCKAACADTLGFSIVVGDAADLEAVELLVTSLLVQAQTAMLRGGRRVDRGGRSRTRAFRRSFLMAYAARIGDRLRAASDEAVAAEDAGALLPVLRDHETRVSAAFEAMVPHTVGRSSAISDPEGWAAGQVAADLALLDVHGTLHERTG